MAEIKRMFGEVQYELLKIILLNVFLSTVILFLAADLVALVFNMPIWYVIVAALLYFAIVLWSEARKVSVAQVERSNPELKEMLRTAKDNEDGDTLMAHALFHEVLEKMKRVSSGTFLDFRKLMAKLAAVFVLAIVLVSIAFFNVNVGKFDNPFAKPIAAIGGLFGKSAPPGGFDAQQAQDDVFGDARMAQLGGQNLSATINPSLDSPDFNKVDPANPSGDPLQDLGAGDAGFNQGGPGYAQGGLGERDLQRSYEYSKRTQEGSG